jgi:hypothetical protein
VEEKVEEEEEVEVEDKREVGFGVAELPGLAWLIGCRQGFVTRPGKCVAAWRLS